MNARVSPRGKIRRPRYDPIEVAIARHGRYCYPTTSGFQRRMERLADQEEERKRKWVTRCL